MHGALAGLPGALWVAVLWAQARETEQPLSSLWTRSQTEPALPDPLWAEPGAQASRSPAGVPSVPIRMAGMGPTPSKSACLGTNVSDVSCHTATPRELRAPFTDEQTEAQT